MATVTKTFSFLSNSESFVATSGPSSTLAWDGTTGNPAGALKSTIAGRSKSDTNYWEWTGTWEALGVPTGSIVTAIRVNAGYTRCSAYTTGASSTIGPYALYDNTPTLQATLWTGRTVTSASVSWTAIAAQADQSVPSGIQASSSTIRLRLSDTLATGASNSATVTTYDDEVSFVITYSTPIASSTSFTAKITGQNIDNQTLDAFVTGASIPALGQVSWAEIQIPRLGTDTSQSYDTRLTGRLTSNQAWDVRLTAQNTAITVNDARITGQASNNITYDIRETSQATNSIAYDVRQTGQSSGNRSNDARIISPTPSSVSYDTRLTGQNSTNLAQDARLTAFVGSSIAYDSRLTGRQTSSQAWDARTFGALASSQTYDIRLISGNPISVANEARLTGQASSAYSQDARILSPASTQVAYDIRITGLTSGVANANDVRLIAQTTGSDTQDARLTGQTSAAITYSALATGQASSNVAYDSRTIGQASSVQSYDARTTGKVSAGVAQAYDARLTGQTSTILSQDARITASQASVQSYDAHLTAQTSSAQAYDARITGNITGGTSQEYTAKITAQTSSAISYSALLTGQNINNVSFAAWISGQTAIAQTNDARVTAQQSGVATYDVRLMSGVVLTSTLDARITSASGVSLSTDVRLSATFGTQQFARPTSDVSVGTWTSVPGGTLASTLDETIASDTDYIISSTGPLTPDVAEVLLSPISDPLIYDQHNISYRYRTGTVGGMPIQLTVRLMQGATEIASWVHPGIQSTTVVNATQYLTITQAQSITDYTNLRLRFEAYQISTPFVVAAFSGERGSGSKSTSSTQVIAPISNATAGNTLVLVIANQSSSAAVVTSVTDSRGNTWTIDAVNSATGAPGISICSTRQNQAALRTSDTITVTMSGSTTVSYWLEEFVGQFTKDVTGNNSGSAGTTLTTSGTTTTATEFVVSTFTAQKNGAATSWSWTTDPASSSFPTGSLPTSNSVNTTNAQYQILSSAGAISISDTVSSNANAGWKATLVAYKVVGS